MQGKDKRLVVGLKLADSFTPSSIPSFYAEYSRSICAMYLSPLQRLLITSQQRYIAEVASKFGALVGIALLTAACPALPVVPNPHAKLIATLGDIPCQSFMLLHFSM